MAGSIIVLGSSFIARLKKDAQNHVNAMEEDFGIHDHRVIVEGKSGGHASGMRELLPLEELKRKDTRMVFLQAGGNDLTQLHRRAEDVIRNLESLAAHLRAQYGVKSIYVGQVVCRLSNRKDGLPFDVYNDKARRCNLLMRSASNFKLWPHRGLRHIDASYLSGDGVHFNADGQRKFYRSIRRCILQELRQQRP